MTADDIQSLFTGKDGAFRFARWGRPIVPVVFGVGDDTLSVVKGAIEAIVTLAGHKMAETDPELGANVMMFFFRSWAELPQVPNLERLVPGLESLCQDLTAQNANQYRSFRFDDQGAIKSVFVFLRMEGALADLPATDIALYEASRLILTWGDQTWATQGPLVRVGGTVILRPDIASIIKASYDPVLPPASDNPALAYRLAARI